MKYATRPRGGLDVDPRGPGSITLYATIFLPENWILMLACDTVFTTEYQQLEWLKRDESNRVYWFETRFLS